MLNYEILEKLTRTIGVSGEEDDVRSVILSEIEPYADEIHISPLGNILAFKKGEKRPEKKLMLCAHMHDGRQYPPGGALRPRCAGGRQNAGCHLRKAGAFAQGR